MKKTNIFPPKRHMVRIKKEIIDWKKLPLTDVISNKTLEKLIERECPEFRSRLYSPHIVLELFLSQILGIDRSCRKATAKFISSLSLLNKKICSASTSAYCQARKKLPLKLIKHLSKEAGEKIETASSSEWLWKNRVVRVVDGTTVIAPDTKENQADYPQNPRQIIGLGFPIIRMVGIFSISTGALLNLELGLYSGKGRGEVSLLKKMLDFFNPKEIVLMDSLFASTQLMSGFINRQGDFIGCQFGARITDFRRGTKLARKDHIVNLINSETGQIIEIREVEIQVQQIGFRPKKMIIVTSLLDHKKYSKNNLADLYLQRWYV